MIKVYEDDCNIYYKIQDYNGFEIYRIDYKNKPDYKNSGRKYRARYKVELKGYCCEFFNSLKEAREFTRSTI